MHLAPSIAVRQLHRQPARSFRRPRLTDLPVATGVLAGFIGAVVLIGYGLGVPFLTTLGPQAVPMKANAALALVLIGTALVILDRAGTSMRWRRAGVGLALSVAAIGGVTTLEYLTGRDIGIDHLLFPASAIRALDRMAPMTSIGFLLLGSAAVSAALGIGRRMVIATATAAIVVAVLNLFAFAFAAASPSFLAGYTAMAAHTAIALALVGLGVIGLLGSASPFAPLAGRSSTAVVSRHLLAVSIAAPVVLAWLRLQGERLNLFDAGFGVSIMLVGTMTIIVTAILTAARWAGDLDSRRAKAEAERDSFFEMSPDMLVVMGRDGVFHRVNQAWVATFGYAADQVQGRPWTDFVHPEDLERTIAEADRNLGDGEDAVNFANRYRCSDGSYRWLEWMSNIGPDGTAAFAVARDVTDRREAETKRENRALRLQARNERLAEDAVRDPLTGLHNRRFFDAAVGRLEQSWSRGSMANRPPVAIIMFDLDNFGVVNKQHGHQVGDAVLRAFGLILRDRFRTGDLVARYGGEEFVAVLQGAISADAMRIAESVRSRFEATTVDSPAGPLRLTVSAGVAQLGDEPLLATGLALADVWLVQAKRAGKNVVFGL
jgi:diguanylate cyclase (GGDEF)-like protein/PAS domain S-box-containing protein